MPWMISMDDDGYIDLAEEYEKEASRLRPASNVQDDVDHTGDTLQTALSELKDAVSEINSAIEPHMGDEGHAWGQNPIFELKLGMHKQLLRLIEHQKELSEGIVALLQSLEEYAQSHKRRPPMPPPPRPRLPSSERSGALGNI